jgi:hypothetical protein
MIIDYYLESKDASGTWVQTFFGDEGFAFSHTEDYDDAMNRFKEAKEHGVYRLIQRTRRETTEVMADSTPEKV